MDGQVKSIFAKAHNYIDTIIHNMGISRAAY